MRRRPIHNRARLLTLAGLVLALLAGGCAELPGPTPDGRTEVVFWHMWTGEWQQVVERIVARFNASQDRIRVRPLVVASGDANTKLLLSIAGGAPPDLMAQWNQVIPAWAHKRALTPLDSLMEPAEYQAMRDWLYPAARDIGTYNGHFYGLCVSLNAHSLLMNAEMLREAGFDPDRPPKTTDELDAMAEKLYKQDSRGKLDRVGFLPTRIEHWSAVFGGELYDPVTKRITANHPRVVKALEWMAGYARKHDVNKIVSFQAGLTQSVGGTYPFIGRKYAMLTDGQWRVEDLRKFAPDLDYRVTPIPYPPGGREKSCLVNGNFLVVPSGARHPREAMEFARFWAGWKHEPDGAEIATWGGWIPSAPSLTHQPPYRAYLEKNPKFQTFLDVAGSPNVRIIPVIPVQAFYFDRLVAAEEAAVRLQKTPQEALDQVTREVQHELDKVMARGERGG